MKQANSRTNVILFQHVDRSYLKISLEFGKGNILFLDGSTDGMQRP
jgi:prepilin-type processing-associated H-X9-DG protein